MQRVSLLFSWSEQVRSSSGYSSMFLVSALFWHATGTRRSLDANYRVRGTLRRRLSLATTWYLVHTCSIDLVT